ncbi:MAG: Hpt domain-containing protein, partial [Lachnospiraceae bacterium]|nr:Hpt domain-containing protein [Lachnospiraceae bacterium]
MDVNQYLEIFLDETKEHLQNLNTRILELEQDAENMDTINEIFRAAHSLKGMAGTMGYKRMQNLTHDMENVFSEVRNGTIKVQPEMIDILFKCLDALEEYTDNIQNNADEGTNDNAPIIKQLNDIINSKNSGGAAPAAAPAEEKKEEAKEAPAGSKWYDIALDNHQITVLEEAKKEGKKIYGINVLIQESCLLKAARAFLVFKAVEEKGEIIVSEPSAQDVEDEKFDRDFTLIVVSDASFDDIKKVISNVSEIEAVTGEDLVLEKTRNYQAADNAPAVTETQTTEKKSAAPAAKAEKKQAPGKPVVNRTVRVDIEKLDSLMNLVSELIIAKNSLVATSTQNESGNSSAFNEQVEYLETVTTNLHESVMKVRMVPIESVVNKFPRMIRDLAKNLDKKMELYMSGEETELDRTVVDEIGDPLMHLLRNAADHGLE